MTIVEGHEWEASRRSVVAGHWEAGSKRRSVASLVCVGGGAA